MTARVDDATSFLCNRSWVPHVGIPQKIKGSCGSFPFVAVPHCDARQVVYRRCEIRGPLSTTQERIRNLQARDEIGGHFRQTSSPTIQVYRALH